MAKTKNCSKCGQPFSPKTCEKTCPQCIPAYLTCPTCGGSKSAGSRICINCDNKEKSSRAKENGNGKWMAGRRLSKETVAKAQAGTARARKLLKDTGQTQVQNLLRKLSNRRFFAENPRSKDPDVREKHNSDYRYREWRTAVFVRDDYTCQVCGTRGGELQAHHIKEWAKYPDLRYVIENGMTVCKGDCHKKAATRK